MSKHSILFKVLVLALPFAAALLLSTAYLGRTSPGLANPAPGGPAQKAEGSYQVVHGWPILPEGFLFGYVAGVGVDSHNHVFVFHRADHSFLAENMPASLTKASAELISSPVIMCFDGRTGRLITSFGANMFLTPHGLRVDQHDNIWVTDVGLQQVLKFSHDGDLLMTVGEKGVAGLDGKHFNKPTDVAVAPDGSFYVSDGYGNSRIAKFSSKGEFILDWGHKGHGPGEFDTPHNVALDREGRVYVADRENSRIQVFQGDGTFLSQWKSAELGRPWAIAFGSDGYLYVVDGGDSDVHEFLIGAYRDPHHINHSHILKLDTRGNILEKWASFGNYDGQMFMGHDIAVGNDGAIYVGDIMGRRVQKFARQ